MLLFYKVYLEDNGEHMVTIDKATSPEEARSKIALRFPNAIIKEVKSFNEDCSSN